MSETAEILPLDPVAFVAALILAPILFTVLTFWVLLIPVFALFFGAVPYLVIGTPVILTLLLRYPCTKGVAASVGFLCAAILLLITLLTAHTQFVPPDAPFLAAWGLIFAPLWAATFASLYNRFYHHPAA
jgi:hypothetical protein